VEGRGGQWEGGGRLSWTHGGRDPGPVGGRVEEGRWGEERSPGQQQVGRHEHVAVVRCQELARWGSSQDESGRRDEGEASMAVRSGGARGRAAEVSGGKGKEAMKI
ncbi:hypothetical protein CYMTET_33379, partial [Cymbomonas tetramitiformis]